MPAAACRIAPEAAADPELEVPATPFTAVAAIFRDAANRQPDLRQRRLPPLTRRKWGREVEPQIGGGATMVCLRPQGLAFSRSQGGALEARPFMNLSAGAPPLLSLNMETGRRPMP